MMRNGSFSGVDITAPMGTPLTSQVSGKVVYDENKDVVRIKSKDGLTYSYVFVNKIVNPGDFITKGQVIGIAE
jgi:murein DD-endopeptidase MepM/ murein hydrolase activator NlpD